MTNFLPTDAPSAVGDPELPGMADRRLRRNGSRDQPGAGSARASADEVDQHLRDAAELIACLEKQLALYQQLKDLATQQSPLIGDGAADALIMLLGQRQGVVDALVAGDKAMEPYRRKWPALAAALTSPTRQRIGGLIERIDRARSDITAMDNADRARLKQSQGRLGSDLNQLSRTDRALRAYAPSGRTAAGDYAHDDMGSARLVDNRFTDRKG